MPRPTRCLCGTCKICRKRETFRKWREANKHWRYPQANEQRRRKRREDQEYAELCRERARQKYRETGAKAPDEEALKKMRARAAVQQAVKRGEMVKPDVCSWADGTCMGAINAHHAHGYEPEHRLDVVWLCRSHHMRLHKNDGRTESVAA